MGDSDKATAPENKQNGGSSILDRAPENVREYLKNKLPGGISDEEAAFKLAEIGMNAEKLIGRKEDDIVKSLFEDKDSKLMQALKEKKGTEESKEGTEPESPPVKGEEFTEEEAKRMLDKLLGDKYKEIEERVSKIDQRSTESEKRQEKARLEQQINSLDNSYKQLITRIPEEEVGPYVTSVLEILWDSKTGKPRQESAMFLNSPNPVKAALQFYLDATGSNPELLGKLSSLSTIPFTEGSGGSMPAGKASSKSPTDAAFEAAIAADEPHELYEVKNRK
jgi:hypothetical protein